MRLFRLRIRSKTLLTLAAAMVAFGIGLLGLVHLGGREILRGMAANNDLNYRLNAEYERDIRTIILLLRREKGNGASEWALTDHLFDRLRMSRVANNSKGVAKWERAAQSPERVAIALKWAEVAANEAAYEAALHAIWKLDYAKHQGPHHVTNDEVRPFEMPEGWTPEDLRYGHDK